jgi:hypothetical protein
MTRVELERTAQALLGRDGEHVSKMTDRSILEAVIVRYAPGYDCRGRSDDEIATKFEAIIRSSRADAKDGSLSRAELERAVVAVLGEHERPFVAKLDDRQLHQAILQKLAPHFELEGRSDAALEAAARTVLASRPSTPAPLPRRLNDDEQRESLLAEFAVLERQRLDAWKVIPTQPGEPPKLALDLEVARRTDDRRTDFSGTGPHDFAAEFAELEAKRLDAWRPRPKGAA